MCRYIWVTDSVEEVRTLIDLEKVERVKEWPPTTIHLTSGKTICVKGSIEWMLARLNDYACWCKESKIDLSGVVEHLNGINYTLQGIRGSK